MDVKLRWAYPRANAPLFLIFGTRRRWIILHYSILMKQPRIMWCTRCIQGKFSDHTPKLAPAWTPHLHPTRYLLQYTFFPSLPVPHTTTNNIGLDCKHKQLLLLKLQPGLAVLVVLVVCSFRWGLVIDKLNCHCSSFRSNTERTRTDATAAGIVFPKICKHLDDPITDQASKMLRINPCNATVTCLVLGRPYRTR
jgi:hypothetical protein